MYLAWFLDCKLNWSTLLAKIWFPGEIVQVRVNGGGNLY